MPIALVLLLVLLVVVGNLLLVLLVLLLGSSGSGRQLRPIIEKLSTLYLVCVCVFCVQTRGGG